ncbi:MAG: metallophosphoesterase [Anaerolineae bacterium]|jgi:predicted MPP superfamily phosphohydrolase
MGRISRRQFLRRTLGSLGAAALASAGSSVYAHLIEPHWLALRQVEVNLEGLPAHLEGSKLALLADLHRGPHVTQGQVARAVDLAQAGNPDLILLVGDFVSQSAAFIQSCADELARMQAPGGIYACLGNHDHWTNAERVARTLAEVAGIEVLRNQALEVNEGLWLAGVDDVWEQQADLERTLSEVTPDATVLLLAHEPDFADRAAADGRVMLQLSGHSHGGQVHIPLLGPPLLPYLGQRYPAGLYRIGQMQLYVTRGVGLVAPPVRLNCRPEVTLLTLTSRSLS